MSNPKLHLSNSSLVNILDSLITCFPYKDGNFIEVFQDGKHYPLSPEALSRLVDATNGVYRDSKGKELFLHAWVTSPEPDNQSLHNFSFEGSIEEFKGNCCEPLVRVVDMDDDSFDFYPWELTLRED